MRNAGIIALWLDGARVGHIAKRFDVSTRTIHRVIRARFYQGIDEARKTRNARIVTMRLDGDSTATIAEHFRVNSRTVNKVIRDRLHPTHEAVR